MATWWKCLLGGVIASWVLLILAIITAVWGAALYTDGQGYSDPVNNAWAASLTVWGVINTIVSIITGVLSDEAKLP